MRYLDRIRRNITRLNEDDWPALEAFQEEMKKVEPDFIPFDRRYHEWIQKKNPHSRKGKPQFWIYRNKEGNIQGQQVGIPFSLIVRGKPYRASWAVNLMVEASLRKRGIGNVLSSVLQEENDVSLGIGISDDAYRSYRRAGWIDLGLMQVFVRPIDVQKMLPFLGLSRDSLLHRIGAVGCNLFLRLWDPCISWFFLRAGNISVEQIDRFDPRTDRVWEDSRKYYPVLAKRDYQSLKWRFDDTIGSDRYRRFYLWQRGRLVGYFVLRKGIRDGVEVMNIVDFLCPPSLVTSLMAGALSIARQERVAVLYCRIAMSAAGRRLYPVGFCRRPSFTRIMAIPNPDSDLKMESLSDPSTWFITLSDSDGDYFEESEPSSLLGKNRETGEETGPNQTASANDDGLSVLGTERLIAKK